MAYNIMLACMGGFSTSMLVKKMKEAAAAQGVDANINAVSETELDQYDDLDIIMLGPQVEYIYESLKKEYDIPVVVIDSLDYGTMNGEKVLKAALAILESK
ncbi:PTS sugar transporter subunit IIB [Zophobihabitans entericus]|uniref:PTS sugar transporter subunit IIB n=1 Tax=Zophobihabitans entericus TaxID=1635327 RepID=A0A6G9I9V0_9GAMM|nr:PTS sugar transporter subunit IIB [Zophobihabitans entericus]QIQ20504.1 PTS sugar transporter subunit IIB [Zophobihabitans entericus]